MRLSLFTDFSLRVLMFAAVKEESFSLTEVAEADLVGGDGRKPWAKLLLNS